MIINFFTRILRIVAGWGPGMAHVVMPWNIRALVLTSLCALLPLAAGAQVSWTSPTLVYDNYLSRFDTGNTGVDVATDGSRNVMATWTMSGDFSHFSTTILSAFSTDFGQTWSDARIVDVPGSGNKPSDVELGYAGSGKWVAVWVVGSDVTVPDNYTATFYKSSSTDAGFTWSAPEIITTESLTYDYTIDSFREERPMEMDGDGAGTLIVTCRSHLLTSRDGGMTWRSTPAPIMDDPDGKPMNNFSSRITYAGRERWYHAFDRNFKTSAGLRQSFVYLQTSTDNGQSWSMPAALPGGSFSVSDITAQGLDAVMSVHGPSYSSEAGETVLRTFTTASSDGAQTWTAPMDLDKALVTAVALNGNTAVLVQSDLNQGFYTDMLGATSSDKGKTWTRTSVIQRQQRPGTPEDILPGNPGEFLLSYEPDSAENAFVRYASVAHTVDSGYVWTPTIIATNTNSPAVGTKSNSPMIGANENGRMVAAWLSYNQYRNLLLVSYSNDFGNSWSPARVVGSFARWTGAAQGYSINRPEEVLYLGDKKWIIGWVDVGAYTQSRSFDDGLTWTKPRIMQTQVREFYVWANSNDGTMLGRAQHINTGDYWYFRSDNYGATAGYAPGESYGLGVTWGGADNWMKIENGHAHVSTDNAKTWLQLGELAGLEYVGMLDIQSSPDNSTVVVAALVGGPGGPLRIYRSLDQGLTWETGELNYPTFQPGFYQRISLKWWKANSWILSSSNDQPNERLTAVSLDNGKTWSLSDRVFSSIETSHGRAVGVFSETSLGNNIYSARAELPGYTMAADWQLYE